MGDHQSWWLEVRDLFKTQTSSAKIFRNDFLKAQPSVKKWTSIDDDDVNDDNDDNGFETTPPRRKRELIYEIFLCDSPVQFFSGGICFWAPLNL